MNEQNEIRLAKVIATIIFMITILWAGRSFGDEYATINKLFQRYNKNLHKNIIELVIQAGEKYSISPLVLASIIVVESSANPNAISKGGDYGLMQVRWKVHYKDIKKNYPQVKTAKDLLDPKVNIFTGTQIFARYYAKKKTLWLSTKRLSWTAITKIYHGDFNLLNLNADKKLKKILPQKN